MHRPKDGIVNEMLSVPNIHIPLPENSIVKSIRSLKPRNRETEGKGNGSKNLLLEVTVTLHVSYIAANVFVCDYLSLSSSLLGPKTKV